MSRKKKAEAEPEEPTEGSPAAGGCVLVVVTGTALAGTWAASPTAAVLTVWGLGVGAVWWSVRRTANPAPPPPSEGAENTKPQFTIVDDREGHCTVQWQKGVNGS
jgi:hypothetical protein